MDQDVLNTETENPGRWESSVVRPWHVVEQPPMIRYIASNSWIYREELAAVMVDAAVNGGLPRLLDNATMRIKGQEAIAREKL
jgi:hypothetical protein